MSPASLPASLPKSSSAATSDIKANLSPTQLEGALKGIHSSSATLSKADKIDELRDTFPKWDNASLERVLDSVGGDVAAARTKLGAGMGKVGGLTEMM